MQLLCGRGHSPARGDAEALALRRPLERRLAVGRRAAELVAGLVHGHGVGQRRARVDDRIPAVEALVAVDDLEVLAAAGAEDVERDVAGRAARVDLYDGVLLALAGQVREQD